MFFIHVPFFGLEMVFFILLFFFAVPLVPAALFLAWISVNNSVELSKNFAILLSSKDDFFFDMLFLYLFQNKFLLV